MRLCCKGDKYTYISIYHPKLQFIYIKDEGQWSAFTSLVAQNHFSSNLGSAVRLQLFSHLLKREFHESDTKHLSRKFTEWVYGPITCSLYDLASVDSYQNKSVLEILVYGSDIPVSPPSHGRTLSPDGEANVAVSSQNRHEMLQKDPLAQLLESKWKKFAGGMFFLNAFFYMVYLIVFTAVAYNKKEGEVSPRLRCLLTIHLWFTHLGFCSSSHSGFMRSNTPFRVTCISQARCSPLRQTATSVSQGYITSTISK